MNVKLDLMVQENVHYAIKKTLQSFIKTAGIINKQQQSLALEAAKAYDAYIIVNSLDNLLNNVDTYNNINL